MGDMNDLMLEQRGGLVDSSRYGEGEQRDWLTKRQRQVRTSELLILGVCLGLSGLFLSLIMTSFSSVCDSKYHLPVSVKSPDGEWYPCKSDVEDHLVSTYWTRDNGRVVPILGSSCHTSEDCGDHSFCWGGPHGLKEGGYCLTNDCQCKEVLFDCGTRHMFEYSFKPADLLTSCLNPHVCNSTRVMNILYWKDPGFGRRLWNLGCEVQEKTTITSAMKYIENNLESMGLYAPLKVQTDSVWNGMKGRLNQTLDLSFESFWPSTISESVSELTSPVSHVFLGFMLLGGFSLWQSAYTNECPTVNLEQLSTPCIHIQINTLREILPPIGLILLAVVPMKPASSVYDLCDFIMTAVHLCGAQFCFVVFLACEAAALIDVKNRLEMEPLEFTLRALICGTGCAAMVVFAVAYGILSVFNGGDGNPHVMPPFRGNTDMYQLNPLDGVSILIRPALGPWKSIKMLSYSAEFIVALALLADSFVVWAFFYRSLHAGRKPDGAEDSEADE